ncbi:MAG: SH3 domain-containing protein [Lachnospiraceae bacterium]|nr:SH3 domain-containing protein [Lachnospiraceae bacterium]
MIRNKIKQSRILLTLFTFLAIGILCMNREIGSFPIVNATVITEQKEESKEKEESEERKAPASSVSYEIPKKQDVEKEVQAQQEIEKEIELPGEVEKEPQPLGSIHIRASWLNVRETPNGTVVGKVAAGEQYDYYEEQNQWLKIKYEDSYGYIFGDYGDIYDIEGNLVTAANIPEPEPEPAPQQPVEQEQPAAQPQQQPQKNPQDMSTPELCQWVLGQIITPDMDDFAKVRAVNKYLCDHMTYDLNYYTTRDAILLGRGRCQGYTNAFKNLMNTLGIPTDYVRGYAGNDRSATHAWNRVLIGGTYYYVDVTWNDSTGSNQYLLLNEAEFNYNRQVIGYNPNSE